MNDPDPLNLLKEVALLRAFLEDQINRWDDIYGPEGALMAWCESLSDSKKTAFRPDRLPNFSLMTSLADRVGAMVDRIQKHKERGVVTLDSFNRFIEQMGVEFVAAVQEIGIDPSTSSKLLDSVDRRWHSIRLDAGQSSDKRAAEGTSPESEDSA